MSITADQEKRALTNVNTQLFIGGEWREASGGATLDVEDPSTGEAIDDFAEHLEHALALDESSLIVLPIDYSLDVAISEELGTETVAT